VLINLSRSANKATIMNLKIVILIITLVVMVFAEKLTVEEEDKLFDDYMLTIW
jgi:hypothetical protein